MIVASGGDNSLPLFIIDHHTLLNVWFDNVIFM